MKNEEIRTATAAPAAEAPAVETSASVTEAPAVEMPAAPKPLTVAPPPFLRQEDTTASLMLDVLIALAPALAWAVLRFGVRALILTAISAIACVMFEALFCRIARRRIPTADLSACVSGVLLAFQLPASAPWWIPVVGAAFAMIVVKGLFGGIGKNPVNPALAARVALYFAFPRFLTGDSVDAVASATPLQALRSGELPGVSAIDLFLGNYDGALGEVSALLLLAGGLYLLARRVITWQIPVVYIGTVALLAFFFPQNGDALRFMLCELFAGGLMLGALFVATDPATSPLTKPARLVYGVGCGLLTVLLRFFGFLPEGVWFAVLIMNLLARPLERLLRPTPLGRKKRTPKKKNAPVAECTTAPRADNPADGDTTEEGETNGSEKD